MQALYQYIPFRYQGDHDLYCALDRNPLSLAWSLYRHGKPFGFRSRGIRQTVRGWKNLAQLFCNHTYHRLLQRRDDSVVELPVSGHVCRKVHNGYKVFDLSRNAAIKVFSPDIDYRYFSEELERVRNIGEYPFALDVRSWSTKDRWYEQEFVNSYPVTDESLIPVLARMIHSSPAERVSLREYLANQREVLHGDESKLSDDSLHPDSVGKIREFVDLVIARLHGEGDRPIFLVFSHGDFTRRHVLTSKSGPVVIDWETIGRRSALYDLHDSLFQRYVNGQAVPDIAAALETGRTRLQSRLAIRTDRGNDEMIESLDAIDIYRSLYYIESLVSYVKQCKMVTEKGLARLSGMIDAYNRFDNDLLGADTPSREMDGSENNGEFRGRYIRVADLGNREQYASLEENPLVLAWLLFRYGKPLHFRGQTIRSRLGGVKRLLYVTWMLLYRRLFPPAAEGVLQLPVAGQLCLRVRNGHKVFDLRQRVAAKVFTQDIDVAKVRHDMDWSERLGAHQFAPSLRDWNVNERWYKEEFVNGFQAEPKDWPKLISLMADTILAFPPGEIIALQHVRERQERIRESQFFDSSHDQLKLAAMQKFVDSTIDRIKSKEETTIFLVCSHGDISPSHVLTSKSRDVVIDWEAAGNRSALYDVHNAFFRRLRGGASPVGMEDAVQSAIAQLKGFLIHRGANTHEALIDSLESTDIYRWVHYVEYIYSYVEKNNMRPRHLDRILFFIDAFNHHEQKLKDRTVISSKYHGDSYVYSDSR